MAPVIRRIEKNTKIDEILYRDGVCPLRTGFVEVGEDKICLPDCYVNFEEKVRTFEVYDDDVFVIGFPKSGTTLTQEVVWLLLNNLDYETAALPIQLRSPQLEIEGLFDFDKATKDDAYFKLEEMMRKRVPGAQNWHEFLVGLQRPRCVKSHLQWSLLPEQIQNGSKKPKIIIPLRNPADVCVSYFYHSQMLTGYTGTFEDFCELFLHGRLDFTPFWKTILSFWGKRGDPNVLLVKYKEIREDFPGTIKRLARFLGKSLTEEQVAKMAEFLSFESMSKTQGNRQQVLDAFKGSGITAKENKIIRAGQVGGYKKEFSPELILRFEAWTAEHLAGTGLSFE